MTNQSSDKAVAALVTEQLGKLKARIKEAASKAGRDENSITIVAVSKSFSPEHILAAYDLGLRDFGESYIQEWLGKKEALAHLSDIRWHFIGNLQSNKIKFLYDSVACVHSINRANLAKTLNTFRLQKGATATKLPFLLELQIDPDDSNKHGLALKEAIDLLSEVKTYQTLEFKGFMGMGPAEKNPQELKLLFDTFHSQATKLWDIYTGSDKSQKPIISLGMSDDLEIAIAAGSNLVRIGSYLFGDRS